MSGHAGVPVTRIRLRQGFGGQERVTGALYGPREGGGHGAVPSRPLGSVSALTGDDRFCNRIAAVEPVFPMTFKLNFRLSTLPVRD